MPGHATEPGADVLRCQGGFHRWVAGVGEGIAIGACRLLQIERAAMPDAAAVGIGEAAAIEELRRQSRRVEAPERRLRVSGIGQPEGADPAVAPRLAPEPSERVAAVLGLTEVFCKATARMVAATTVLIGDGIAVFDKISGNFRARSWL